MNPAILLPRFGHAMMSLQLAACALALCPSHRIGQGQDVEETVAIKNTNMSANSTFLQCNPVRWPKTL